MAKVDYRSLHYDVLIGRKYRICGRCKEEMAVTTECPKRVNSANKYVCHHCCLKCIYAIKVPGGSQCSIKANRRKAERERLRKERAARATERKKKEEGNPSVSFADTSLYTREALQEK
ncbi:MAG: hypothetical protein IJ410_03400 [Oscillospiraceae bacterium]|nr:hypothetical protein [Oscillospiraceae bacterium]